MHLNIEILLNDYFKEFRNTVQISVNFFEKKLYVQFYFAAFLKRMYRWKIGLRGILANLRKPRRGELVKYNEFTI
jgi:hypothetical protein